ncbi:MAG: hypothetical protein R3C32_08565 [Chloroflexota bacterium]
MLRAIADRRRADLAAELAGRSLRDLTRAAGRAPDPRPVALRLARPGTHVIAEIKRRSPSAGALVDAPVDVADRARAYAAGGAAMISVLLEPHWFGGSIEDLVTARAAVPIPVLAKEFVVDPRQLPMLRAAGADAVLLLANLHRPTALARLVRRALDLGLEPLVEAHDARELDAALATDARLIGVNNRDLRTLVVDTATAEALRGDIPDDRLVIAESGVRDPALLRRWRALGFDGALIGEDLMRTGVDRRAITARVAAFVAAGALPQPGVHPAADARTPLVKVCGVTEPVGLGAAIAAGVDMVGLNLVPGTKRALGEREAIALARAARASRQPGAGPRLVGVFADRPAVEVAAMAGRIGLDVVQLHGDEPPADLDAIRCRSSRCSTCPRRRTTRTRPRTPPWTRWSPARRRIAPGRTWRRSCSTPPTRRSRAAPGGVPRRRSPTPWRAASRSSSRAASTRPTSRARSWPSPRPGWTWRAASRLGRAPGPEGPGRRARSRTRSVSPSSPSARGRPDGIGPTSRSARRRCTRACSRSTGRAAGAWSATSAGGTCPRPSSRR